MKLRAQNRHVIDLAFPVAVFFLFAALSFAVLLLSADRYHRQTEEAENAHMVRTCLAYVNEKIRQSDANGGISIQTLSGQECLVLKTSIDGTAYITCIYAYENRLKELMIREDATFQKTDGTDIMEIGSFTMKQEDAHLFRFTVSDQNGTTASMLVSERSSP